MEIKHCAEHSKIMHILGEIKAVGDMTRLDIKRLDERVNGSFSAMSVHIKEGETYRNKIIKHDTTIAILMWLFVAITVPLLFLLLKYFAA